MVDLVVAMVVAETNNSTVAPGSRTSKDEAARKTETVQGAAGCSIGIASVVQLGGTSNMDAGAQTTWTPAGTPGSKPVEHMAGAQTVAPWAVAPPSQLAAGSMPPPPPRPPATGGARAFKVPVKVLRTHQDVGRWGV